ncbi:MAG: SDR family oxidoreductase [Paracoccaceae bacterium]|nr:SDR family oxidoreductase [Paracoccaceae bacterium]
MRLQGKRAFLTAAGAGIGAATARAFLAEGAAVMATDIDAEALAPLAEAGATIRRLDVTDPAAVAAAAGDVGAVDILFNCAGVVHHGSLLDCDEAAFDASVALNLKGPYSVTRAFLPAMIAAGGGSVLFVASAVSSIIAAPNRFVYGATKAGVIGMMKSVAADFVSEGIRANAICPATVESPSLEARMAALAGPGGDIEAVRQSFIARQPMGRIGRPEEIAALAVYLASDDAAFVTGQAIGIDGGWANT